MVLMLKFDAQMKLYLDWQLVSLQVPVYAQNYKMDKYNSFKPLNDWLKQAVVFGIIIKIVFLLILME